MPVRFIKIVISVFLMIIICGKAHSASVSKSMPMSVTVNKVFSISLEVPWVDFGTIKPGDFKETPSSGGYSVICKSNSTSSWQLNMKVTQPFTIIGGSSTIPIGNFKWMSTAAVSKNPPYQNVSEGLLHQPEEGYQPFSLLDIQVYVSGRSSSYDDRNNLPKGTEVQFKYALDTADMALLPGQYSTALVYTLTE